MSHYEFILLLGGICNSQCNICSTPEVVLEVHEVFYDSGRV